MIDIVKIKNLKVTYKMKKMDLQAVDDVTLDIKAGKITAIVGESGSGKTTLANSILNILSSPGEITGGEVLFLSDDKVIEVTALNHKELNAFRWKEVSMVFQGAQSSLNPVVNIFDHFVETYQVHHHKMTKKQAREEVRPIVEDLLRLVNLNPDRILEMYPHELSGGMKQRVMIAFSMILNPKLIILDEPTTALDVIVQNYIFNLLRKINREKNIGMLLLTHDIGVVAQFSDYVAVMYGGKLMEYGSVMDVFNKRLNPYTKGLICATPSLITDINDMKPIPGNPPDITMLPSGCVFHPRCEACMNKCMEKEPKSININEHIVKCHLYDEEKCE